MEEEYKRIKHKFYCRGQYPELKELHNLFDFVDGLLVSGADYKKEDPSPEVESTSVSPRRKKRNKSSFPKR